jgi:hypothetical protein
MTTHLQSERIEARSEARLSRRGLVQVLAAGATLRGTSAGPIVRLRTQMKRRRKMKRQTLLSAFLQRRSLSCQRLPPATMLS